MRIVEMLEAERIVKMVLKRNFIDDFCCGEDLGLNLDLNIENLTSGYYTALRELGLDFDDDEISESQYTQTKCAIKLLYDYYRQTLVNSMKKNVPDDEGSLCGEEFIDLPDFVDPDSPEAQMYIDMYKKYNIGDGTLEEQELFERFFSKQIFGDNGLGDESEKIEGKRSLRHF